MGILNFFKKQFWKPTVKFFPRSLNQIFVGRAINNLLFWLFIILNIAWWIVYIKEVQPAVNTISKDAESLFFGDFYYESNSIIKVFLVLSFLTLLFSCFKIAFLTLYYVYYKIKPITVEESIAAEEKDNSPQRPELAKAQERLDYINQVNQKPSEKSKKNKANQKKKTRASGTSLKKLN